MAYIQSQLAINIISFNFTVGTLNGTETPQLQCALVIVLLRIWGWTKKKICSQLERITSENISKNKEEVYFWNSLSCLTFSYSWSYGKRHARCWIDNTVSLPLPGWHQYMLIIFLLSSSFTMRNANLWDSLP